MQNIVICCDGTNNSFRGPLTNIAVIYRLASPMTAGQTCFYDEGVGASAEPGALTKIGRTINRWIGLAFGTGLVHNLQEAYEALARVYSPGDRVFLFGFSRGAYTVRVLGGLLQNYGLLRREEIHRAGEVCKSYSRLLKGRDQRDARSDSGEGGAPNAMTGPGVAERDKMRAAWCQDCRPHFLGVFDTVSSLGWLYDRQTFPNTAFLAEVRTVRHALAIDERRAKFRTNRISPAAGQDVREVWFPGVHADVGGGYAPPVDRLPRLSLSWMLSEAKAAGLLVDAAAESALGLGASRAADELAAQNESLEGAWKVLEQVPLPRRAKTPAGWIERRHRYLGKGWRHLREGDWASTALRRRAAVRNVYWAQMSTLVQWERFHGEP